MKKLGLRDEKGDEGEGEDVCSVPSQSNATERCRGEIKIDRTVFYLRFVQMEAVKDSHAEFLAYIKMRQLREKVLQTVEEE